MARSAKQKAATRKLVALNKRRAKKSKPKRRSSKPRKVNKRKSPTKRMAKRRSTPKRSFTSKIPLVNNPTIRKAATGIGLATIGVAALAAFAPQFASNPIVKPALAFLGGGVPGIIGQVIVGGGIGGLTNIFSSSSNGNGGGVNAGFA